MITKKQLESTTVMRGIAKNPQQKKTPAERVTLEMPQLPTPRYLHRTAFVYERVSTDEQQHSMQHTCNIEYASRNNLPIAHTSQDTASGALPWMSRSICHVFGFSTETSKAPSAERDRYSDVIVYELSRIGRDLSDTLRFLSDCAAAGITVHISRTGTRIDGGINGKIMATVLGLAADIEREFIRTRTRDALDSKKKQIEKEGGFTSKSGAYRTALGRPVGSRSKSKLEDHREEFAKLVRARTPDTALARIYGVSRATAKRFRDSLEQVADTSSTPRDAK